MIASSADDEKVCVPDIFLVGVEALNSNGLKSLDKLKGERYI